MNACVVMHSNIQTGISSTDIQSYTRNSTPAVHS